MSKFFFNFLMISLTFMLFTASNSMAQTYVSGNVAWVELNDADVKFTEYGETPAKFTFDNGYGVFVALGHTFENGFRSEVELGYRENDADKFEWKGIYADLFEDENLSGDFSALSLMANSFYDIKTGSAFTPFVGIGLGFARLDADGEKDTVFAYQGSLGISYALTSSTSLDLQYRYFATQDPEFKVDGEKIESEYSTHNMMLGLRYSF